MPRGLTKRRPLTRARLLDAALDQPSPRIGFPGRHDRAGPATRARPSRRGAFYSNFASKEELFLRAVRGANAAALVVERMEGGWPLRVDPGPAVGEPRSRS